MNEEERKNLFLKEFKELEERLVILSRLKGDYVSYSRALDKVHYAGYDPLVMEDNVFQFLKTAGDLRNLLSHENDVAVPTESFLKEFSEVKDAVCSPVTAFDICTKGENLLTCGPLSQVDALVKRMGEKHLSHVPVIKNHQVVGVFSTTTFFEAYMLKGRRDFPKDLAVGDLVDLHKLSSFNDEFLFVGKDENARNLLDRFRKKNENQKRVSCLFVTYSGSPEESLIGIITETDLLKVREIKVSY